MARPRSQLWLPPLIAIALSLAPLPFLANRYRLLPENTAIVLVGLIVVLAIAIAVARSPHVARGIVAVSVVLTLAIDLVGVASLVNIVLREGSNLRGFSLLLSATEAWLGNVAGFALVYWYLNEVSPRAAGRPVFLFPDGDEHGPHNIADYIYVAATTALAFGPTDTPPAGTGTRMAMLFEAIIAFVIVVLVAARAINAIN